jgi:hypothetical protein
VGRDFFGASLQQPTADRLQAAGAAYARGLAGTAPAPLVVYECERCAEVTLHHCAP